MRTANGARRRSAPRRITLGTDDPEHFLTVDRRVGRRTWAWGLETSLTPRLLPDGGVGFVDPATHRVSDLTIAPVVIFDSAGDDVTPSGLRWQLGKSKTLELNLRDDDLPEPYRDRPRLPLDRRRGRRSDAPRSRRPCLPAVLAGDQLVAFVSRRPPRRRPARRRPARRAGRLIRNEREHDAIVALWTLRASRRPAPSRPLTRSPSRIRLGSNVAKTSRAIVAAYSGIKVLRADRRQLRQQQRRPQQPEYGQRARRVDGRHQPDLDLDRREQQHAHNAANPTIQRARSPDPPEQIDSTAALPSLGAGRRRRAGRPSGPSTVGTGSVLSGNARWAAQVFGLIPEHRPRRRRPWPSPRARTPGRRSTSNSGTSTHCYNTGAGGDFTVTSTADRRPTSRRHQRRLRRRRTDRLHAHDRSRTTTSPYTSNAYTWTQHEARSSPGANQTTVTSTRNANTVQGLTITRDANGADRLHAQRTGGRRLHQERLGRVRRRGEPDRRSAPASEHVSFRRLPGLERMHVDGRRRVRRRHRHRPTSTPTTWPAGQADGAYRADRPRHRQRRQRARHGVAGQRHPRQHLNRPPRRSGGAQLGLAERRARPGLQERHDRLRPRHDGRLVQASLLGDRRRLAVRRRRRSPRSAAPPPAGRSPGSTADHPRRRAPTHSNTYGWAGSDHELPDRQAPRPTDAVGNSLGRDDRPRPSPTSSTALASPRVHDHRQPAGPTTPLGWAARSPGRHPTWRARGPAPRRGRDPAGLGQRHPRRQLVRGQRLADLVWVPRPGRRVGRGRARRAAKPTSGNVYAVSLRAIDHNVGNIASTNDTDIHLRHGGADIRHARAQRTDERLCSPARPSTTAAAWPAAFTLSQPLSRTPVGPARRSVAVPGDRDRRLDARTTKTVNGASPYISSLDFSWSVGSPMNAEQLHADRRRRRGEHGDARCVALVADSAPAHRRRADGQRHGRDGRRLDEHVEWQSFTISRTDYTDAGVRRRIEHAHARLGTVFERRVRDVQRQPDDDRRRAGSEPRHRLLRVRADGHRRGRQHDQHPHRCAG